MITFHCPNCHGDKVLGDKTGTAPSLTPKGFLLSVAGSLGGLVLLAIGLAGTSAFIIGAGALAMAISMGAPVMAVFWRPVQTFRCLSCGYTVRGRSPANPREPGVVVPLEAPDAGPGPA